MFGKFMNNYYYGKSGKGDYTTEDLPRTRMQLFWEMLRVRLSALCRMNLMYMLSFITTMLVTSLNCVGDSVAAVAVANSEGQLDENTFNA